MMSGVVFEIRQRVGQVERNANQRSNRNEPEDEGHDAAHANEGIYRDERDGKRKDNAAQRRGFESQIIAKGEEEIQHGDQQGQGIEREQEHEHQYDENDTEQQSLARTYQAAYNRFAALALRIQVAVTVVIMDGYSELHRTMGQNNQHERAPGNMWPARQQRKDTDRKRMKKDGQRMAQRHKSRQCLTHSPFRNNPHTTSFFRTLPTALASVGRTTRPSGD